MDSLYHITGYKKIFWKIKKQRVIQICLAVHQRFWYRLSVIPNCYPVYWIEHESDRYPYKWEIELNSVWLSLIWELIDSDFYLWFDWLNEWADRITPRVSMPPRQWDGSGMGQEEKRQWLYVIPSLLNRSWKWQIPVQMIVNPGKMLNADRLSVIWAPIDSEFYLWSDWLSVTDDCITFRVSISGEGGTGRNRKKNDNDYA